MAARIFKSRQQNTWWQTHLIASMNMTTRNLTTFTAFFLFALAADAQAQKPQPTPVRIEDGLVQGTFEDDHHEAHATVDAAAFVTPKLVLGGVDLHADRVHPAEITDIGQLIAE
jgi:hypothetical protein